MRFGKRQEKQKDLRRIQEEEERARREKRFDEIAEETQIARKLQETETLFRNISDEVIPYGEDGITGDARFYNYLRVKEQVSVAEAVNKYIEIAELLTFRKIRFQDERKRWSIAHDYISYLGKRFPLGYLNVWIWEETFFYVEEANLQASEDELEQIYNKCRENKIHIILKGLSLTENRYFHIRSGTVPGSADDAATYIEYTPVWEDRAEG